MKNTVLVLLSIFSLMSLIQAQTIDLKKVIKSADDQFKIQNYYGAEKLYIQAYDQDSLNKEVNFKLGVCKYEMKDYLAAEQLFIKSSSAVSLEIFRYKAAIAHASQKFKKAINYYNAYKIIKGEKDLTNEEVNALIAKSIYAEDAISSPRNVSIVNVGATINTAFDEYVPLISADEELMVFTSRRPGNTGGNMDHQKYRKWMAKTNSLKYKYKYSNQ